MAHANQFTKCAERFFLIFFVLIFRLPWDQNTFGGWVVEAIFSVCSAFSFLFVYPTFLIFFISICEYQNAFLAIFRSQCIEIGTKAQNRNVELNAAKAIIRDAINFHNLAKEYVEELSVGLGFGQQI